jgi:hypothetical protein
VQQQATIPEPNAQAEEQLRGEGFDLAGRSRGRRKERDCGQTEMGETGRRCRRRTASARRGRRVGAPPSPAVAFRALQLDRWREHRRGSSRENMPGWPAPPPAGLGVPRT